MIIAGIRSISFHPAEKEKELSFPLQNYRFFSLTTQFSLSKELQGNPAI